MKKIITLLSTLIILIACSTSSVAKVSDESTVIFKGPNVSYTKADLNNDMKVADYSGNVLSDILLKIAEKEEVDIETLRTDAQANLDQLVAIGYGEYIVQYYGSLDTYVNNLVADQAVYSIMQKKIENDLDTYVEEYHPYKAKVVSFDTEDEAKAVLEAVNNGSDLQTALTDISNTTTVTESIYTDKDEDLALEIKNYALNTESGMTTVITSSTTTTNENGEEVITPIYYLVDITDKDVNNFKDDFIETVISKLDSEEVINELLSSHDIKFYDQRTYELMSGQYEVLK